MRVPESQAMVDGDVFTVDSISAWQCGQIMWVGFGPGGTTVVTTGTCTWWAATGGGGGGGDGQIRSRQKRRHPVTVTRLHSSPLTGTGQGPTRNSDRKALLGIFRA